MERWKILGVAALLVAMASPQAPAAICNLWEFFPCMHGENGLGAGECDPEARALSPPTPSIDPDPASEATFNLEDASVAQRKNLDRYANAWKPGIRGPDPITPFSPLAIQGLSSSGQPGANPGMAIAPVPKSIWRHPPRVDWAVLSCLQHPPWILKPDGHAAVPGGGAVYAALTSAADGSTVLWQAQPEGDEPPGKQYFFAEMEMDSGSGLYHLVNSLGNLTDDPAKFKDGSVSFPVPGAAVLLGSGLLALAALKMARRKS